MDVAALDGTNGFVISGRPHLNHYHQAVGTAGDVDGDGFDDLMIGDPNDRFSTELFGANAVVFGGPALGSSGQFDLDDLDGDNGFTVYGGYLPECPLTRLGFITAWGGESRAGRQRRRLRRRGFDHDRLRHKRRGYSHPFRGHVGGFRGDSGFPPRISAPQELDGENGFVEDLTPGYLSRVNSISAAGDVDGDGYGDLIIGQPNESEHSPEDTTGWTEILFGGPDVATTPRFEGARTVFRGLSPGDQLGTAVTGGGDINGDGFADVAFTAPGSTDSIDVEARVYVMFGATSVPGRRWAGTRTINSTSQRSTAVTASC